MQVEVVSSSTALERKKGKKQYTCHLITVMMPPPNESYMFMFAKLANARPADCYSHESFVLYIAVSIATLV